jgi:hypothetical protein
MAAEEVIMDGLYDQDFYQEPYPVNQLETDTPEAIEQDWSDVGGLETEASWQETQTEWDGSWQNEVTDSFNYQPDEPWQSASYEQGFNYEESTGANFQQQLGFEGLGNVQLIADEQQGPTCGYETIENIVQCFHPYLGDTLSDSLQAYYPGPEGAMAKEDYQRVLESFDIPSHWAQFDHREIVEALDENRPVAFIGDAHDLDPISYSQPESWHAITLTDVATDLDGNVIGYKGVDSNFTGEEKVWSLEQIEQANQHFGEVLITDKPAEAWPFKTT